MQLNADNFYLILKDNIGSKINNVEFDKIWVKNAYPQVIWKLLCYN